MAEAAEVSSLHLRECRAADMLVDKKLPPLVYGVIWWWIGRLRVMAEAAEVSPPQDVSGGRYACSPEAAASDPSPRCPAMTGCALGVVGRCVEGDTAMVRSVRSIDRIEENDILPLFL